jgi:hypothetical protein
MKKTTLRDVGFLAVSAASGHKSRVALILKEGATQYKPIRQRLNGFLRRKIPIRTAGPSLRLRRLNVVQWPHISKQRRMGYRGILSDARSFDAVRAMGLNRCNPLLGHEKWRAAVRLAFALIAVAAWAASLAAQQQTSGDRLAEDLSPTDAGQLADNLPPPSPEQIAQWIEQLGHNAFAVRQSAAERLVAAGLAARDAIAQEIDSPDPETRAAARRIVALIDASEANRRLAEFAADTDGSRGITLPGWKEFGELVGQDEAARTLFVDMQRHESQLLAEFFGPDPHEGRSTWDERLFRLRPMPGPQTSAPPVGSCATMMFLGSLPNSDVNDARVNSLHDLAVRTPLREGLLTHREPNVLRSLVVAWITKCPNRSERALGDRLQLMFNYRLQEALPLPAAIAHCEPEYLTVSPILRASAALAVGRFGTKENAATLEPLLDDDSTFPIPNGPQGTPVNVHVSDVALATMIHLVGQEPKEYGFTRVRMNPQNVFDPASLGLENREQRTAAIAKWRAWKAAQNTNAAPQP